MVWSSLEWYQEHLVVGLTHCRIDEIQDGGLAKAVRGCDELNRRLVAVGQINVVIIDIEEALYLDSC